MNFGMNSFVTWLGIAAIAMAHLTGCATGMDGIQDEELASQEVEERVAALEVVSPAVNSVLATTAALNLRSDANAAAPVLRVMAKNVAVTVVQSVAVGGFYKINHAGTVGWASGSYLTLRHAPTAYSATRESALRKGRTGMGFGYWWGHAKWVATGATSANRGYCTSNADGSTSYTGTNGADCSGFVSKVWVFPARNTDVAVDLHGPSTGQYNVDSVNQWSTISAASATGGDAFVYNSGGSGHIFLLAGRASNGDYITYECRGCSYGCLSVTRTPTSAVNAGYHAIRRYGW